MEMHRSAGKVFLVLMLVTAGISAAIAPVLADLFTATAAAAICYCLVVAMWNAARQGHARTGTTNLLGAV
jgi:hypothetical protein